MSDNETLRIEEIMGRLGKQGKKKKQDERARGGYAPEVAEKWESSPDTSSYANPYNNRLTDPSAINRFLSPRERLMKKTEDQGIRLRQDWTALHRK